MVSRHTLRARPRGTAQSPQNQSTVTSLWRQAKPGLDAPSPGKEAKSAAAVIEPETRLPTPTATPTKRKHVCEDSSVSQSSHKRTKIRDDSSTSFQQLASPDATPTRPVDRSVVSTSPATPSKIRLNGRDLLNRFKAAARPDDIPAKEATVLACAPPTHQKATPAPKPTLKARNAALLQRLATKQEVSESQPLPPSKAEALRKAALQRVADVVRVISTPMGLDKTSTRRSYSASGLAQTVRQSARNVIGEREVLDVLRLLQDEEAALVCEGFVRLVKVGEGEAVVIDSAKKPQPAVVEGKVQRLLKSCEETQPAHGRLGPSFDEH